MSINIKQSGNWDGVSPRIKVGGNWEAASQVYYKTGGNWEPLLSAGGGELPEVTAEPNGAWNLNDAFYEEFSVGAPEGVNGVFMRPDGSQMFTIADSLGTPPRINTYSLPVLYNLEEPIASATTWDLSGQMTNAHDFFWKPDGNTVFVQSSSTIFQYSLSTPWDIASTRTLVGTGSAGAQESQSRGIYIRPDGTKLFVVGEENATVYRYSMSTPWDISTLSYDAFFFSGLSAIDAAPQGIFFKSDGTKMFVAGQNTGAVHQFTLSTAWDPGSATYDNIAYDVTTIAAPGYQVSGLHFDPDGEVMFTTDELNYTVNQHKVSLTWDMLYADSTQASLDAAPELVGEIGSMAFKPDGKTLYIADFDLSNQVMYQYSLVIPWQVTSASYTGKSFNFGTQISTVEGIAFKTDGTKAYIGDGTETIFQYSLSTPWDLSTMSYDSVSFDVSAQANILAGFTFKQDGSSLYIIDSNVPDRIVQYNLSTPWVLSTATVAGSKDISADGSISLPFSVAFRPDGKSMYVVDRTGTSFIFEYGVKQYELTTPWDVTTASFNPYTYSSPSATQTVTFRPDGATMFLAQGFRVRQVSLDNERIVASVTQTADFSVPNQTIAGIFGNPDVPGRFTFTNQATLTGTVRVGTFPPNSTLTIINNGNMLGPGGNGNQNGNGLPGGDGLLLSPSVKETIIYNGNGFIKSGGGAGGASYYEVPSSGGKTAPSLYGIAGGGGPGTPAGAGGSEDLTSDTETNITIISLSEDGTATTGGAGGQASGPNSTFISGAGAVGLTSSGSAGSGSGFVTRSGGAQYNVLNGAGGAPGVGIDTNSANYVILSGNNSTRIVGGVV